MAWSRATCHHCDLMETYEALVSRWEDAADQASYGYATELQEWIERNPRPTFKQYLIDTKGR